MKLVIVESPYKGNVEQNVKYARRAIKDCLERGESPLASHLLYTQVLNDNMQMDRRLGIEAGLSWLKVSDAQVVYQDYGISDGMRAAVEIAINLGIPVEYRSIGENP